MSHPKLLLEVKQPVFQFLWVKYITGFDVQNHCAKGLLGRYSKRLPYRVDRQAKTYEWALDEFPAPYVYICGTTGVWARNVHLAVEPAAGEVVEVEDDRIRVVVDGARQIPIVPIPTSEAPPLGPEFLTCRNYQFGWTAFDGAKAWANLQAARAAGADA